MDLAPGRRFLAFDRIDWNRVFFKTYHERRSFGHLLVNFNRIWVLHFSMYWYYMSYNSPAIYTFKDAQGPTAAMTWSATALGGAVATFIVVLSTFAELSYVRATWNIWHLTSRLLFLCVMLALNAGPTIYIALHDSPTTTSSVPLILGIVQFCISVVTTLLFSVVPLGRMFGGHVAGTPQENSACATFTASFLDLDRSSRLASFLLWFLVFGCKFTESYFFLVLSLHNPIQTMVGMKVQKCNDRIFGTALCSNQAIFTLTFMYLTDLVLFFLDTYVWYISWNMVFSIARSFMLGLPNCTLRKKTLLRLPQRIYSKLLSTSDTEVQSKVWLPTSAFRSTQLRLILLQHRFHIYGMQLSSRCIANTFSPSNMCRSYCIIRSPQAVMSRPVHCMHLHSLHLMAEDGKGSFSRTEARRSDGYHFSPNRWLQLVQHHFLLRLCPHSQCLHLTILRRSVCSVDSGRDVENWLQILLTLREIIREGDQNTRITILEYLKVLHQFEWNSFSRDSAILEQASSPSETPAYYVGFRSSSPEFMLRTRTWASLRSQTLYRTVAGMMNYSKAIKLLYRVENSDVIQKVASDTNMLDAELDRMARRKFKYIVSMQRYSKFNSIEQENAEHLLSQFPDLQIAYLEEEPPRKDGQGSRLYSALIDGHSPIDVETGRRRPKFRIELPGNPIIGDGKSDNLNHAIIFYRGEYLQLIDANQDNYLEECLKIRNVLAEFGEYPVLNENPYAQWDHQHSKKAPVAIVGAREYIFSENIGVLGDLAALKEQTLRTLQARTLSWLGGKLHCGHPDFFNGIFMTTRGGVSKAQRALHLTGDIYAGITAFGRGGHIKHAEYYQCGKGRDLGFGTILNFQTKKGCGMGEQILSREYYHLGMKLPIDRLLTFYYGHPGFYINNVLVIMCLQVLTITSEYML